MRAGRVCTVTRRPWEDRESQNEDETSERNVACSMFSVLTRTKQDALWYLLLNDKYPFGMTDIDGLVIFQRSDEMSLRTLLVVFRSRLQTAGTSRSDLPSTTPPSPFRIMNRPAINPFAVAVCHPVRSFPRPKRAFRTIPHS